MQLLCLVSFVIVAPSVARATDGLRGSRWSNSGDDAGIPDSDGLGQSEESKKSGDFMDQYIAASEARGASNVWFKKDAARPDADAVGLHAVSTDSADMFARSSRHAVDDADTGNAAPAQAQRQGGGAVVDVTLDSELQVANAAGHRRDAPSDAFGGADSASDSSSDSASSGGGDYMDRYIAAAHNAGGGVWFKKPEESAPHAESPFDASSGVASFGSRSGFQSSDSDVQSSFQSSRQQEQSSSIDSNNGNSDMPRADADAQPQKFGRGGAVVSVTLDSELQESKKARVKRSLLQVASAPNVEANVAQQKLMDVYIHETFGQEAAADVLQEQEINDSPDMKP